MLPSVFSIIADLFQPARLASPQRWPAVWRRCEAVAIASEGGGQPIGRLIARALWPMLIRTLLFVGLNGVFSFAAAVALADLLARLTLGAPGGNSIRGILPTIVLTYIAWLALNHVFVLAQTVGIAAKAFVERLAVALVGGSSPTDASSSVASFIDRECGRIENAWGGGVMVVLALSTLLVSGMFFLLALGPAGAVALMVMGLSSWLLWHLAARLSANYEQLSEASRRRVSLTSFVLRARRSAALNGWNAQLAAEHSAERAAEEVPLRRIASLVAAITAISSVTPVLSLLLAAASQLLFTGHVSVTSLLAGIAVIGGLRSVANGVPDAIANLTQGRIAHCALDEALRGLESANSARSTRLPTARGRHVSIVGAPGSGKSTVLMAAANATNALRFIFVPSEPTVFSGSVRAFLTTDAPAASETDLCRALHAVRLSSAILYESDGKERQLSGLERGVSRGQAKRLELARAILSHADEIYLDQPSMGLDVGTRDGLLEGLLDGPWRHIVVTFVTDDPGEAHLANETWTVSHGEVVDVEVRLPGRQPVGEFGFQIEVPLEPTVTLDARSRADVSEITGGVVARLRRGGFWATAATVACLLTLKEGLSIAGDFALTAGGWGETPKGTILKVAVLMLTMTIVAVIASLSTVHAVVRRSTELCQAFFVHLMDLGGRTSDPMGRATRDQRRIDESLPAMLLEAWGAAALLAANVAYVMIVAPVVAVCTVPLASTLVFLNIYHRRGLIAANAVDVSRSANLLQSIEDLASSLPRLARRQRVTLTLGWINAAMQARSIASYQSIQQQRSFGYRIDLLGIAWFCTVLFATLGVDGANGDMALGLSLTYSLIAIFGRASRTFLQLDQLLESSDRLLTQHSSPTPAQGALELGPLLFESLRFHREGSTIPVIAGLDATIPAASLAVVLGPSGVGKSTMASLILGELAPTSGRICLGGNAMPTPGTHPNLLQAFDASPVFKPGPLFAHFGVDAADSHEFAQAVGVLGLHEIIASLPGGARFEVPRSGELPLSKSAAQMVALLRLMTRPAQIALLDEATSELRDAEEIAFLKRIRRACPHTTILAITHNQSLRILGDVVITFEGDGIVSVDRQNHGVEQIASP